MYNYNNNIDDKFNSSVGLCVQHRRYRFRSENELWVCHISTQRINNKHTHTHTYIYNLYISIILCTMDSGVLFVILFH